MKVNQVKPAGRFVLLATVAVFLVSPTHSAPGSSIAQNSATAVPKIPLALGLPADEVAAAVVLRAEDRREHTDELGKLLTSENANVRARAALALGRIGLPASMSDLLLRLQDTEAGVRALAAFALGRLELDLAEDPRRARIDAGLGLEPLLADEPRVAAQVAWALGQLGTPQARSALSRLLQRREELHAEVVAAALGAWWRINDTDVPTIRSFVASSSPTIRLAAAHSLRRLDDPNAQVMLVPLLQDDDQNVRAMAARGMRRAPLAVAEQHASALISSPDWRVAAEGLAWVGAAWSLSDAQPSEVLVASVVRASMDRNLHLRRLALQAFGPIANDWTVARERLLEGLESDEQVMRTAALEEVAQAGGRVLRRAHIITRERYGFDQDTTSSEKPPGWVRGLQGKPFEAAALVRLLTALPKEEKTVLALNTLANHGPPRARTAALEALLVIDPEAGLKHLYEALRDGSPELQGTVASLLERMVVEARPDVRVAAGWAELLAQTQSALVGPGKVGLRKQVLMALQAIDKSARVLLGLIADRDRVIRLWALRQGMGRSSSAVVALGPQATELNEGDYRSLARRALELQRRPPILRVETARGTFRIQLIAQWAPRTVMALLDLVEASFYDGVVFHRVMPAFVLQGGDPTATGAGGARLVLRSEDAPVPYARGTFGMALGARDSIGSQWFVTHTPQPQLEGLHPAAGVLIEGQRAADRIQPGDAMRVTVES